jgi:DNA-binding response OmpR family regulator
MNALAGKRVLVVDDDSLLALDLELFLKDEGCVVLGPAPSVDAALALIAAEPPEAAVLDLDLGGTTSAPVADALAARDVGFLFISGHSHAMLPADHADRPLLAKPWSEAELRRVLTAMLG